MILIVFEAYSINKAFYSIKDFDETEITKNFKDEQLYLKYQTKSKRIIYYYTVEEHELKKLIVKGLVKESSNITHESKKSKGILININVYHKEKVIDNINKGVIDDLFNFLFLIKLHNYIVNKTYICEPYEYYKEMMLNISYERYKSKFEKYDRLVKKRAREDNK